jgi:DNA-binding NarL/FixJ family response regulator
VRVLVADDHAPTREDITTALGRDGGFEIIATAEDAPGAIDAALREQPDLALLDVNMPGSGLAAAWEITARLPSTRVVMLTISRDDSHVFAALRAGAAGYLLKDTETERLPQSLKDVMAGEAALPVTLVTRLVEEFRDRAPRRRALMPSREGEPRLTSREWEVLELMRRKMTTAQIARTLVVSPATVRSHVAAILRKLRVPDRDAAVRLLDNPEA